MGRLDGKVAVVSGAARGQGRAHAVTMAREGASIVAFDICAPLKHPKTPGATLEDLQETARQVEEHDQQCLFAQADARDLPALRDLADQAVARFGRIDILVVNHGIWVVEKDSLEAVEEDSWQESIDVLLTGAWKVCKAFTPKIIEGGRGGAIVLTGSVNSVQPQPSAGAYVAAKHGVAGLMKTLALELGEHWIRVNTVNPGGIATPMLLEGGTIERATEFRPNWISHNRAMLPVEWISPQKVADAVLWLVSDEASNVTGAMIPVDSGWASA